MVKEHEVRQDGGIVDLRTQILGECIYQQLTASEVLRADALKRTRWSSSQR